MCVDVKTTQDARESAFRRDVLRYRYHIQDAFYRNGLAANDVPVEHFVFISIEKSPPHAIGIYEIDTEGVSRGYSAAHRGMATLAECLRTDHWPDYGTSIITVDLPPWGD